MADRFDSYAVSGAFGGLENIVFLLYFAIEGVLHMNQKEMIMVGVNFHINLSAGRLCFRTCLDGIFQQIGKHKAQINLIYAFSNSSPVSAFPAVTIEKRSTPSLSFILQASSIFSSGKKS